LLFSLIALTLNQNFVDSLMIRSRGSNLTSPPILRKIGFPSPRKYSSVTKPYFGADKLGLHRLRNTYRLPWSKLYSVKNLHSSSWWLPPFRSSDCLVLRAKAQFFCSSEEQSFSHATVFPVGAQTQFSSGPRTPC
jgi:hypothetical protein